MSDRTLGYIALSIVAAIALASAWLVAQSVMRPSQNLIISASDIGTLKLGDPITISGVTAGKAVKLGWNGSAAIVTAHMVPPVPIYRDYRIAVVDIGIMGDRLITLEPGTPDSGLVSPADTLRAAFVIGPSEALGMVGQLQEVVHGFARISSMLVYGDSAHEPLVQRYARVVWVADSVSRQLDHLTRSAQGLFDQRMDTLLAFIDTAVAVTQMVEGRVPGLVDTVSATVDSLAKMVAKVERFVEKLEHGYVRIDSLQNGLLKRRLASIREQLGQIGHTLETLRERGLRLRVVPFRSRSTR